MRTTGALAAGLLIAGLATAPLQAAKSASFEGK